MTTSDLLKKYIFQESPNVVLNDRGRPVKVYSAGD